MDVAKNPQKLPPRIVTPKIVIQTDMDEEIFIMPTFTIDRRRTVSTSECDSLQYLPSMRKYS